MGTRDALDYRGMVIRVVENPPAHQSGDGWWRTEWEVTTEPPQAPARLQVPAPPAELGDMAFVIAVWPREAGHLTVQMLSKNPQLEWNEYAYLSLVMQSIGKMYTTIKINGHEDHPILKVSRM